ncbi:hypothetical protein [Nocardiopsis sp. NPDC058789]|uniref:hypothetical protein n=1 Tax=Nocardiopsis sp. NPDC058789 TaxID=3346634 RepID=UPI00366E8274
MPKMLTVDERFDAIVSGVTPEARIDPFQEPTPKESVPAEREDKPEEKKTEDK